MSGVTYKIEGLKDVLAAFEELAADIGDKKARSKILVPAAREAMKPVLTMARMNAPKDTGDLARTMQIEARRPTRKDMRSKYITEKDTVIALVTTKAFPKKLKKEFYEKNADLYKTDKAQYNRDLKERKRQVGVLSDARAIAQEFGTARMKGHQPFLRPALESQADQTAKRLGEILARRISKYRIKNR
jgi:HK97 gp10 family phage protein